MWKVWAKCPNRERLDCLQGCVEGVGEDGDFRVCGTVVAQDKACQGQI
ncbi:MAG: hypothetical protein ACI4TU_07460 [Candidatus Cryptobacteroides sp.]